MASHPPVADNTQRFSGRAEDYDRFRQRYPAHQVLAQLRNWCGLEPTWRIADIGAGTGMLAEVFLENSNRVLAVEPNPDMRAASERLTEQWPQLEVINATAEHTTLSDASVDLVAAGRAFHWFDKERALAEFRRILKPHGWLALVSLGRNHRPTNAPEIDRTRDYERLLTDHGTDYAYVRSGYRVHDNLRELFPAEAAFHQLKIPGTQQLDWNSFRGQTMSISVAPRPDHPNYESFQHGLRRFFDTYSTDGILTMPTTCYITAAQIT